MKRDKKQYLIWISSFPKSGNTWMRLFLSYFVKRKHKNTIDINELTELESSYKSSIFESNTLLSICDLTDEEVDLIRPSVYRSLNKSLNDIKFLKSHDTFRYNIDQKPIYPIDSMKGVIYVVRNPLDVAVSMKFHSSTTFDLATKSLCKNYGLKNHPYRIGLHEMVGSWNSNVNSWLDASVPKCIVRYEDLKSDTLSTFSKVLDFCEIPYDNLSLSNAIEYSSFDKLKEQENSRRFKERLPGQEKFFRKGEVNAWKNYLSQENVNHIMEHCNETMHKLGYIYSNGQLSIQEYEY